VWLVRTIKRSSCTPDTGTDTGTDTAL